MRARCDVCGAHWPADATNVFCGCATMPAPLPLPVLHEMPDTMVPIEPCVYRGEKMATVNCGCSGPGVAYRCHLFNGPCMDHALAKPWTDSMATAEVTVKPKVCALCDHHTPAPKPYQGAFAGPWRMPEERPQRVISDRLVITVATGAKAQECLTITGPRMQAYAERCNADFLALTDDAFPSESWYKVANKWRIASYARHYDHTLFLDADCLVLDPLRTPDIFELATDNIAVVNEYSWATHSINWVADESAIVAASQGLHTVLNWQPNAGVLLIPGPAAHLYSPPPMPVPRFWCAEQHWLGITLGENRTELPKAWNTGWVDWQFWRDLPAANIAHTCGAHHHDYRLSLLRRFAAGDLRPLMPPAGLARPAWPNCHA